MITKVKISRMFNCDESKLSLATVSNLLLVWPLYLLSIWTGCWSSHNLSFLKRDWSTKHLFSDAPMWGKKVKKKCFIISESSDSPTVKQLFSDNPTWGKSGKDEMSVSSSSCRTRLEDSWAGWGGVSDMSNPAEWEFCGPFLLSHHYEAILRHLP